MTSAGDSSSVVDWDTLCEVEKVSMKSLPLSLFLKNVSARVEKDMPSALKNFSNDVPISQQDQATSDKVAKVCEFIERVRNKRRSQLAEQVMLDSSRYSGERMSLRVFCWIVESQCNLLVFLLDFREYDNRTGGDFNREMQVATGGETLTVYMREPVIELSAGKLRFALLRLFQQWIRLPVLHPAFQDYMMVIRLRISMLQVLAWAPNAAELADYPRWAREVPGGRGYRRASTSFSVDTEMYFYYVYRQIRHEEEFHAASVPVPLELASQADADHLRAWVDARADQIMVQQLRREVNARALETEVVPPERGIYRSDNPVGYSDNRTVLMYMRGAAREQIDRALTADLETVCKLVPTISAFYRTMFLIQGDAHSFDMRDFFWFVDDFQADEDGCSYPPVHFFTNQELPLVYIPQTRHAIYVVVNHQLYRCPPDIWFAMAVWFRAAVGLWYPGSREPHSMPQFDNIVAKERLKGLAECMMYPGYRPPLIMPATSRLICATAEKEPDFVSRLNRGNRVDRGLLDLMEVLGIVHDETEDMVEDDAEEEQQILTC